MAEEYLNEGFTVKVLFENGRIYEYNCDFDVDVYDKVRVSGKLSSNIGIIICVKKGKTNNSYFQSITEIVEQSPYKKEKLNSNEASDFEFHEQGNGVIIDKYIGNSKNVIFPETINGKPVFAIGDRNLEDKRNYKIIESITLPDSCVMIGESAFEGCVNLKEVNMPFGLRMLGKKAFKNCRSLNKIILPESLTTILSNYEEGYEWMGTLSDTPFERCWSLKEIIFFSANRDKEDVAEELGVDASIIKFTDDLPENIIENLAKEYFSYPRLKFCMNYPKIYCDVKPGTKYKFIYDDAGPSLLDQDGDPMAGLYCDALNDYGSNVCIESFSENPFCKYIEAEALTGKIPVMGGEGFYLLVKRNCNN